MGYRTVLFGNYCQSSLNRYKKPIEWLILDEKDGSVLLLSRYAIDCKKYDYRRDVTTWENCILRKWLNSEFISEAFTFEEMEKIDRTLVLDEAHPVPYRKAPVGNNTYDRVFLLSKSEVDRYLTGNESRLCAATGYALTQGVYVNKETFGCNWWLRSSADYLNSVINVSYNGSYSYHINKGNKSTAVRPAMWVSL